MINKNVAKFLFLIVLFIPISCYPQQSRLNKYPINDLRSFIERNFKFIDSAESSMKSDFAILRIEDIDDTLKIEFMSFNNRFHNSLNALKDSLLKKWSFKSATPGAIYIPIHLAFNDEQLNPNFKLKEAFDMRFWNNSPMIKDGIYWLRPVILIKYERVI